MPTLPTRSMSTKRMGSRDSFRHDAHEVNVAMTGAAPCVSGSFFLRGLQGAVTFRSRPFSRRLPLWGFESPYMLWDGFGAASVSGGRPGSRR